MSPGENNLGKNKKPNRPSRDMNLRSQRHMSARPEGNYSRLSQPRIPYKQPALIEKSSNQLTRKVTGRPGLAANVYKKILLSEDIRPSILASLVTSIWRKLDLVWISNLRRRRRTGRIRGNGTNIDPFRLQQDQPDYSPFVPELNREDIYLPDLPQSIPELRGEKADTWRNRKEAKKPETSQNESSPRQRKLMSSDRTSEDEPGSGKDRRQTFTDPENRSGSNKTDSGSKNNHSKQLTRLQNTDGKNNKSKTPNDSGMPSDSRVRARGMTEGGDPRPDNKQIPDGELRNGRMPEPPEGNNLRESIQTRRKTIRNGHQKERNLVLRNKGNKTRNEIKRKSKSANGKDAPEELVKKRIKEDLQTGLIIGPKKPINPEPDGDIKEIIKSSKGKARGLKPLSLEVARKKGPEPNKDKGENRSKPLKPRLNETGPDREMVLIQKLERRPKTASGEKSWRDELINREEPDEGPSNNEAGRIRLLGLVRHMPQILRTSEGKAGLGAVNGLRTQVLNNRKTQLSNTLRIPSRRYIKTDFSPDPERNQAGDKNPLKRLMPVVGKKLKKDTKPKNDIPVDKMGIRKPGNTIGKRISEMSPPRPVLLSRKTTEKNGPGQRTGDLNTLNQVMGGRSLPGKNVMISSHRETGGTIKQILPLTATAGLLSAVTRRQTERTDSGSNGFILPSQKEEKNKLVNQSKRESSEPRIGAHRAGERFRGNKNDKTQERDDNPGEAFLSEEALKEKDRGNKEKHDNQSETDSNNKTNNKNNGTNNESNNKNNSSGPEIIQSYRSERRSLNNKRVRQKGLQLISPVPMIHLQNGMRGVPANILSKKNQSSDTANIAKSGRYKFKTPVLIDKRIAGHRIEKRLTERMAGRSDFRWSDGKETLRKGRMELPWVKGSENLPTGRNGLSGLERHALPIIYTQGERNGTPRVSGSRTPGMERNGFPRQRLPESLLTGGNEHPQTGRGELPWMEGHEFTHSPVLDLPVAMNGGRRTEQIERMIEEMQQSGSGASRHNIQQRDQIFSNRHQASTNHSTVHDPGTLQTEQSAVSEESDRREEPDIKALAREVYPLIKRMIMLEKERKPF
jgi:hypothetical protein